MAFGFLALTGCTFHRAPLGSAKNPIKLFFVPSVDSKLISDKSRVIKKMLEKLTPYKYHVAIPASYIAVIEAFGTKRADVASLNTFGYILANEKYGVQARLTVIRYGLSTYNGAFFARADGPVKKLSDITGKKFAFVDPASTSGYLLPEKLFKQDHIKPAETVFAESHNNVISMVYQRQVDAGVAFYSPPEKGQIEDARRLVLKQYPDVAKKIKIIGYTDSIPNDPIVFRKGLPEKMKEQITNAFLEIVKDPKGRNALQSMYGVTAFKKCTDADYDNVRQMLKNLGQSAENLMKK